MRLSPGMESTRVDGLVLTSKVAKGSGPVVGLYKLEACSLAEVVLVVVVVVLLLLLLTEEPMEDGLDFFAPM